MAGMARGTARIDKRAVRQAVGALQLKKSSGLNRAIGATPRYGFFKRTAGVLGRSVLLATVFVLLMDGFRG